MPRSFSMNGHLQPVEFEESLATGFRHNSEAIAKHFGSYGDCGMSCLRHGEFYRPMSWSGICRGGLFMTATSLIGAMSP
jgi:hypothetical protein